MKQSLKQLAMLLMLALIIAPLSSCGSDDDEPELSNDYRQLPNYNQFSNTYDRLVNTTWALVDARDSDGDAHRDLEDYIGQTITFTGDIIWDDYLKLKSSLFPSGSCGLWRIEDDGTLFFTTNGGDYPLQGGPAGSFLACMGGRGEIVELNSQYFVFRRYYSSGRYTEHTYEVASHYDEPDSPGDEPGGGYEKPDIGFYDFTCYGTSSITVQFVINNKDEAAVSSAKVYYGESSPSKSVTASVIGRMIIARLNGLKAGTEYEVKCKATGRGGSATSDTYTVVTNY